MNATTVKMLEWFAWVRKNATSHIIVHMYVNFKTGLSSCGDGDIQLVGGESEREGRVEICYNGVWGTVCADSSWNEVNANAVCQQLGITYQRALPINDSHFGAGDGPILLENLWCSEEHSNLSQCVDFMYIGGRHHCEHTAGVICMDEVMMSTSTEEVPTATVYVTTANMSCDSTYKSHDTTSTASGSSAVAIIGAVGVLIIMVAIAVITMVLIARLRLKANR